MPTGYTAELVENGQSFPDFAMRCARAFGALVHMRDVPMDAPIPDKLLPESYLYESLERDKASLARLEGMTTEMRIEMGERIRTSVIVGLEQAMAKNLFETERIDEMTRQVNGRTPPTKEHQQLKEFMLEQLKISRYDTSESMTGYLTTARAKTPLEYFDERLTAEKHRLDWSIRDVAAAEARLAGRNEWVKQLRDSLTQEPVKA